MTPAQEIELFAQLRGLPRFVQWLDDEESKVVRLLKLNHEPARLCQAQGQAHLLDRMRDLLTAASK